MLTPADQFFIVFALTVAVARTWLFLWPIAGPTIHGVRIHHYHIGLLLLVSGAMCDSVLLYGVGAGLFGDELAFLLMRGRTHADNYSVMSLVGTAVVVVSVFLLRHVVVSP